MNRKERIDNLIHRLCHLMSNESCTYREGYFESLRKYEFEVSSELVFKRLEETIRALHIEGFMKPIILSEMRKIINETPPKSLSDGGCGIDVDCQQFVVDIALRETPFSSVRSL